MTEVHTIQLWRRPNTAQSFPQSHSLSGPPSLRGTHQQGMVKSTNLNPTALVWSPSQPSASISAFSTVGNSPLNVLSHTVVLRVDVAGIESMDSSHMPFSHPAQLHCLYRNTVSKWKAPWNRDIRRGFHKRPRNLVLNEARESRDEKCARCSREVYGEQRRGHLSQGGEEA